jgi:hypothetical protein
MINVIVFIVFLYVYNVLEIITVLTIFLPYGTFPWDIVDDLFPRYIILYGIFFVLLIINSIHALYLLLRKKISAAGRYFKILKLSSILFWIINFITTASVFGVMVFATRGIGIILSPIPVMVSYLMLLATSLYSIVYLRLLYKNGALDKREFKIHLILQLIFTLDIIDTIYLIVKKRLNQQPHPEAPPSSRPPLAPDRIIGG